MTRLSVLLFGEAPTTGMYCDDGADAVSVRARAHEPNFDAVDFFPLGQVLMRTNRHYVLNLTNLGILDQAFGSNKRDQLSCSGVQLMRPDNINQA